MEESEIEVILTYSFSSLFFFGHLWHATRAIFQDIWTGVRFESQAKQEYGRNEKLGDKIGAVEDCEMTGLGGEDWSEMTKSSNGMTSYFSAQIGLSGLS